MATGPRTLQETVDEMLDEGCRLVKELRKADAHVENLEDELKEHKELIEHLDGDLGVALAERDEADEKVMELEKTNTTLTQERDDLLKEVATLKSALQEWEDFEGWRQGRWVMVQDELKRLREELASLKQQDAPVVN